MSQPDFYTMCATVFAPDGAFDEAAEQTIAQARTAIAAGVEALHLYSLIRSDRNDLSRESCSGGWDQYR
jgi:hypothetical protein